MTRRSFIHSTAMLFGGILMWRTSTSATNKIDLYQIYPSIMKEENEEHKKTWMSFVANDYIWEAKQIPEVKRNLALLAKTIAKYEPVSILVHADDKDEAISLLDGLNTHNFPIVLIEFSIMIYGLEILHQLL